MHLQIKLLLMGLNNKTQESSAFQKLHFVVKTPEPECIWHAGWHVIMIISRKPLHLALTRQAPFKTQSSNDVYVRTAFNYANFVEWFFNTQNHADSEFFVAPKPKL